MENIHDWIDLHTTAQFEQRVIQFVALKVNAAVTAKTYPLHLLQDNVFAFHTVSEPHYCSLAREPRVRLFDPRQSLDELSHLHKWSELSEENSSSLLKMDQTARESILKSRVSQPLKQNLQCGSTRQESDYWTSGSQSFFFFLKWKPEVNLHCERQMLCLEKMEQ